MYHSPSTRSGGFGSRPHDPFHPSGIPEQPEVEGCFGLTQTQVDRLRDIIRQHSGVELSNQEAWARAIELVAFTRMLAEAPDRPGDRSIPSGPESGEAPASSPTQGRLAL